VPDPDARPWWDVPKPTLTDDVDYTYGKSQIEMEQERVAKLAVDAAMASIGGGDTRKWAEPTPAKRHFLFPVAVEKGFHDPHMDWPEILHGPYKAFSEMHSLLSQGAQPSDPEVVKRSFEVAGALAGGGMILEKGVPLAAEGAKAAKGPIRALREAGLESQKPTAVRHDKLFDFSETGPTFGRVAEGGTELTYSKSANPNEMYVGVVWTEPEMRRQGKSRALMQKLTDHADAEGVQLRLMAGDEEGIGFDNVRKFYGSLGFKEIGGVRPAAGHTPEHIEMLRLPEGDRVRASTANKPTPEVASRLFFGDKPFAELSPEQLKLVEGYAGKQKSSRNKPPKGVERDVDESGYYSQLRETVAGLQKSEAHPSEYMALLEPGRSGVKEGEIRATGLDKFLLGDEVGEMRRTIIDVKEGLSTLIKTEKDLQIKLSKTTNSHDLKVLERELAEAQSQVTEGKELVQKGVAHYNDKLRDLRGQRESRTREELSKHVEENKTIIEEVRHQAGVTTERDAPGSMPSNIPPRVIGPEDLPHSTYSTDPSNPTMREVMLTVRNPEAEAKLYAVEKKIEELKKERETVTADQKILDMGVELERLSKEKADIQDRFYHTGGHFTSNTAVWYMASIQKGKDGRNVFVPHQVQSDWGQSVKARGSQSPAEIRMLEKEVETAKNKLGEVENKGLWLPERNADHQKALDVADKIKPIAELTDKETYGLQVAIIRSSQTGHWQEGLEQILKAGRDDLIDHGTANRLVKQIDASPAAQDILKTVEEDFKRTYADRIAREKLKKHLDLPPHHPMVGSTPQWVDLAVKRIIKDAIDSGADTIAIPHGKTVQSYTGGMEEGQKKFYEGILPKRLEKALKEMDPSIEGQMSRDLRSHDNKLLRYPITMGLGGHPKAYRPAQFTEFPITDAVRAGLKKQKGSKLYTNGPVAPPQSEENE